MINKNLLLGVIITLYSVTNLHASDIKKDNDIISEVTSGQEVDLGLSVKWAGWNVGATSPEEYGGYYAWDEIEEKKDYSWDTYKYCDLKIKGIISGTKYDVATVKWRNGWKMPTKAEFEELVAICKWEWGIYKDVAGYKVTGPNGNSIFLPCAGNFNGTSVKYPAVVGCYWSGSLCDNSSLAWAVGFQKRGYHVVHFYRILGASVRPVKKYSKETTKQKIYTAVEQMPEFPGGEKALMDFLSHNINYPQRAMENGIQGKVVVQFVVTKNGTVGEVKVLNKVHPDIDNEAIRLIKSLPKFKPGKMNEQAVNVWYTLPITFKLQSKDNGLDYISQNDGGNDLVVKAFGDKTNDSISINSLAIAEDDIVTAVDVFPEFPGGNAALMKFLSNNINYPQEAMDNGIQGKVVVQFIVKKDGTIGTVKVVKSVHPLLDEEAKRLVKMLPKFEPAYRDEKPVNTWYTLPVTFKLHGLAKESKKPKLFKVLTEVDENPKVIGGEETMNLLSTNIRLQKKDVGRRCDLVFLVKKDGTVGDVIITKSIRHSVDEELKRIAKMWLFEPGIKDGKPVDTWCITQFSIKLKNL